MTVYCTRGAAIVSPARTARDDASRHDVRYRALTDRAAAARCALGLNLGETALAMLRRLPASSGVERPYSLGWDAPSYMCDAGRTA